MCISTHHFTFKDGCEQTDTNCIFPVLLYTTFMNTSAVLVTGANGFVGHHLVKELSTRGASVIGLGRESEGAVGIQPYLSDYMSADMTNKEQVGTIDLTNVQAVIHLAGLANVGQSFAEPARFLSANTGMVINLLERAMIQKSIARFVVISSGAVYESKQPLPIPESGQLTHASPYAVSKLAVEMMNDYYRSRGVDVVTMRPFNHFGPNQMVDLSYRICL